MDAPQPRQPISQGKEGSMITAQGARPFPSSPAALRLGQSISPA